MDSLNEATEYINSQIEFHEKMARRNGGSKKSGTHTEIAENLRQALVIIDAKINDLEMQAARPANAGTADRQPDLFATDPFSLDDLPESVAKELHISKANEKDAQITQLLKIADRPLSINEILVGLHRKFEVSEKRNPLATRLYRMANRGDIQSVSKGVYALNEVMLVETDDEFDLDI